MEGFQKIELGHWSGKLFQIFSANSTTYAVGLSKSINILNKSMGMGFALQNKVIEYW